MPLRVTCHACSADLDLDGPLGRNERCSRCGRDLRCCLNCRFHDISSYNDCAEPSAERVLEKDRATFCDYFSPRGNAGSAVSAAPAASVEGLSALENLFRKP